MAEWDDDNDDERLWSDDDSDDDSDSLKGLRSEMGNFTDSYDDETDADDGDDEEREPIIVTGIVAEPPADDLIGTIEKTVVILEPGETAGRSRARKAAVRKAVKRAVVRRAVARKAVKRA